MRRPMTQEEREKEWDATTAVINNLKNWTWSVTPQYKLEQSEAEIVIKALEHYRINSMLPHLNKVKV